MAQHHKWPLSEIENLIPWERDLYVDLLLEHLDDLNNKRNNTAPSQQPSPGEFDISKFEGIF